MAEQKKRIVVNAFEMTCIGHQSFDLWRHPRSRATEYNTIKYWTDLAKTLERGLFDAVFIADVVGIYDVYKNSAAPAIEGAAQVPVNDPATQISAMAAVTEHLARGDCCRYFRASPTPWLAATPPSTTSLRAVVGFNVVTSYLPSAADEPGPAHPDPARRALRNRRRVPGRLLQAVGRLLGRRRSRQGPRARRLR